MVIRNIVGDQNPYANKKIDRPEAKEVRNARESVKTSGEAADRVVLSSEARLRGAALQTAKEAPDVRREKVDQLKRQVQDGTYMPDLKKAAANLIRDDLDLLV
ncbi:flagellar biosynthesis anti-sigma factor FlgM [Pseudodesulfovibrio thermohalotolerans]|jgi:negative regulator of flagellin synthesis FlgM|uniref:flagellar biosynthesis anti-sigma factor FlgM n=1 Tax=Pseudodesulfovibrio thermohalotolerans TaxID=2880651 RepID=UPI00244288D5|nr:flagellar biosynthesis anti-sigma factor FlgM [Pseudodesulfovibrio thermohalotolerans]WFS63799.1 flagellar biosynthesis anti-sigma factor FlgM [Pseudodesulfovibrio thermohalotolerans]